MKDTTRLAVLILATMPIFLGGFVIGTRTRGHGGRRYERRRSRWRSAPRQRACLVLRQSFERRPLWYLGCRADR